MANERYKELRLMVRGVYDLQKLRMQTGLRLCANFRAKLRDEGGEPDVDEDGELGAKAKKLLVDLTARYRRLTDGVARNRTLPERSGFCGDELISTYAELVLLDQYVTLEREEAKQFRLLTGLLEGIPIYDQYLRDIKGVGPAMAAVLISELDPRIARHASSF